MSSTLSDSFDESALDVQCGKALTKTCLILDKWVIADKGLSPYIAFIGEKI